MATATMTSKGQITIPAKIREAMGLKEGTQVEFVEGERGEYRIFAKTLPVTALEGILYDPNRKTVTIEEMNETIAQMGSDSL
jgi:AbrB family looped-hinge helix DNA binding protein